MVILHNIYGLRILGRGTSIKLYYKGMQCFNMIVPKYFNRTVTCTVVWVLYTRGKLCLYFIKYCIWELKHCSENTRLLIKCVILSDYQWPSLSYIDTLWLFGGCNLKFCQMNIVTGISLIINTNSGTNCHTDT